MRVIVIDLDVADTFCERLIVLRRGAAGLRRDSVGTRCATLRGRLGPRFLFGDLGALVSRVRCGPRGTMIFARGLSSICHCVLGDRRRKLIALHSRLRFLSSCVCLRRIHLKGYVRLRGGVAPALLGGGVPSLALRLLVRGIVGRGVVGVRGPVIVRLSCSSGSRALSMEGGVGLGGSITGSKVKLGGLSTHCLLVYGLRVAVVSSSRCFAMGVPLLGRWSGDHCCEE